MINKQDWQYFRVQGHLADLCRKWKEEVHVPLCTKIFGYVYEEFNTENIVWDTDMNGARYVKGLSWTTLDQIPSGMMRSLHAPEYIQPDKRLPKGKRYAKKFQELKIPVVAEPALKKLFGNASPEWEGDGYWRRAHFFECDDSWFFMCDVDQAIERGFDENQYLIPLTPMEMRIIEKRVKAEEV